MAHSRFRYEQKVLLDVLKFSPIVGVLGHRQVGKTTLISKIGASYKTLDIASELRRAQTDPDFYIQQFKKYPAVLDEVQICPELFPALKEHVRTNKRPGQFILSGSVRFTSRKAIRESLTGRIINLELLPFSYSELHERPVNDLPIHLLTKNFEQLKLPCPITKEKSETTRMLDYGKTGGLPGACFVRKDHLRAQLFESQLETILDRDLRMVLETKLSFQTLRAVLSYLAMNQGEPINFAAMARSTRVSVPTLRGLIHAFEQIFLIRVLPSIGGETRPIIFMEDQGEAYHLTPQGFDEQRNWLRILYANIRIPFSLRPELQVTFSQYRTRGNAYVPLVTQGRQGTTGWLISHEVNPERAVLMSAVSFQKKFKGARVVIVGPRAEHKILSPSQIVMPIAQVLF